MNRSAQSAPHQSRRSLGQRSISTEAVEFFNVLTSPELLHTTDAHLPEHRERLYPPTVALSVSVHRVTFDFSIVTDDHFTVSPALGCLGLYAAAPSVSSYAGILKILAEAA